MKKIITFLFICGLSTWMFSLTATANNHFEPGIQGWSTNSLDSDENSGDTYNLHGEKIYFSDNLSFLNYLWEDTKTAEAGFKKVFKKVNAVILKENIVKGEIEVALKNDVAFTIGCPAPIVVNNDSGKCYAIVIYAKPTSSAGNTVTQTAGLPSGSAFPVGVTTNTFEEKDDQSGAIIGSCSFTVTVNDTQAPTISCVGNKTKSAEIGKCYYTVVGTEFNPTVSDDNCGVASVTNDFNASSTLAGAQIPNGTIIKWTVTDTAGLSSVCSFTLTVNDTQAPTIPVLPDLISNCSLTVPVPTTTDNCGGIVTVTTSTTNLKFDASGSIFWTFKDTSGNSTAPVEQKVIINDVAPVPVIATLPTQTITGCQILSISELTIPSAIDECDGVIEGTLSPGFVFPFSFYGTNTIEWEFIDSKGNKSLQTQDITLIPPNINGGTISGTFNSTVFSDQIDISSCDTAISIALNLAGETGTIIQWEKFAVNQGVWEVIPNTNTKDNYIASFGVSALVSTYYRVLVQVGTCNEYSNIFYIRALPAGSAPTVESLDPDDKYCLGESVNLVAISTYIATQETIPNSTGDFNQGQLNTQDPDSWLVDDSPGGFTAGGNATKPRNWSATNDHPFGGITYDSQEGKFSIAYGDYGSSQYKGKNPTTLESPILDLSNAISANLDFDQAYYFSTNDYANIEISIDGGVTYAPLREMHVAGSPSTNWFTAGTAESYVGSDATHYNFDTDNTSISLAAYLGQSNVRIRWSFTGTSDQSVWAMDNIFVNKEVFVNTELELTNGIGDPDVPPIVVGQTDVAFSFTADTPGVHQYGGTALINGCRTYSAEGTVLINISVSNSYAGKNIEFTPAECGQNTLQLNAYDNFISANANAAKGAYIAPPGCTACDDPGTEDPGEWSWVRQGTTTSCIPVFFSDRNDPDATFTGGAGTYTLTWTVSGCSSDITVTITDCSEVNFDGVDDYVDFNNNYNLNGDFSLEVWVKPESVSGTRTIFSKRDANKPATGYDLKLNEDKISFNWNATESIVSLYPITINRWYHIAVTHTGSLYNLYIDGILTSTAGGTIPAINTNNCILGTNKSGSNPVSYFNGYMQELRIWNKVLTPEQLHQMMNQKIKKSGTDDVIGEIVPIVINGLSWSNLAGYYHMDTQCGHIMPAAGAITGRLRNIFTPQPLTAPLPYTTKAGGSGSWDDPLTWTEPVWSIPNDAGIGKDINDLDPSHPASYKTPIDWNIVQTSHNIIANRDITLLGLISESGKLTMGGVTSMDPLNNPGTGTGQGLWITHYLKLNGVIDLQGESQLVQKRYGSYDVDDNFTTTQFSESIFEETSIGYIERDQQGQKNSFNYNYWSSPVTLQGAANNAAYKLPNVLKDGTNPATPININFVDGAFSADGAISSPIKITSRWIWTYKATVSADPWANYYQWTNVGYWGNIKAGDGFTMKGTGGAAAINALQNYVFVGKPNSGDIQTTLLTPGQIYLIGNPYPSALDADEFIKDNIKETINGKVGRNNVNVFNGALYFWDHFTLSNNHLLAEYEGGYATYNLMGGVIGIVNVPLAANTGKSGTKVPERYIPVGQGFFVEAILDPLLSTTNTAITGGNLNFKNSQRVFKREGVTGTNDGSLFMKTAASKKSKTQKSQETTTDTRSKIRLIFDSPLGYRRPLLVGVDENASNHFDLGYDAPMNEDNKEDMFWTFDGIKFVIQGVDNFDKKQELPLGLKIFKAGIASIKIDKTENLDKNETIFILDKLTGISYEITKNPFEITLQPGEYLNRFFLTFKKAKGKGEKDDDDNQKENNADSAITANQFFVFMNNTTSELQITKPVDAEILSINVYNYLGQAVKTWNTNLTDSAIYLPIKVSSGAYIVQINTKNGTVVQKVIVE
ncbi:MAG: LamG-like jellyroll fold domain-containing protein [Lutibacter sp.]